MLVGWYKVCLFAR